MLRGDKDIIITKPSDGIWSKIEKQWLFNNRIINNPVIVLEKVDFLLKMQFMNKNKYDNLKTNKIDFMWTYWLINK